MSIGSITGGGRYDDLTGIFGMPEVSGVGISFGADRIYDVLNELDLYPKQNQDSTQVLFINFGTKEERHCLSLVNQLRAHGMHADLYPEQAKMKKQMKYANDLAIPYVALVGNDEIENNTVSVKDMETGSQKTMSIEDLINQLKNI